MLGFEPAYTTAEAFADFGSALPPTGGRAERLLAELADRAVAGCCRRRAAPARRSTEVATVADAEIIPIGTRGRPGRGTGTQPSSRRARPRPPGEGHAARPKPAKAAAGQRPRRRARREGSPAKAAPRRRPPGRPRPPPERRRRGRRARGAAAARRPARDDDADRGATRRHPGRRTGSRRSSTAAREVFGEQWEPQLARFLAFLRRRVTGDYVVDEYGFDAGGHRAVLHGRAAPDRGEVVPHRGPRRREHPRPRAAPWSSPTTPARSRSTA